MPAVLSRSDRTASEDGVFAFLLGDDDGDAGRIAREQALRVLLGRRADGLTDLWNDWGSVRPILLEAS